MTRGQDGMGGAPGLFTAFRDGKPLGKVIEFLEGIGHFDFPGKACSHRFAKGLGKVFPDDKDHLGKPRPNGIKDRVVEDRFPARTHRINLFQATVATPHPGGQNNKCGSFYHFADIWKGSREIGKGECPLFPWSNASGCSIPTG